MKAASITAMLGVALSGAPVRAAPTHAEDVKLAVLPVGSDTKLRGHLRRDLANQVVDGLGRGGFEVEPPNDVLEAHPAAEDNCDDAACYTAVAKGTGATHVVRTFVYVDRKDYRIVLEAYDAEHDHAVATVEDTCEVCGKKDATRMVADLAAALSRELAESLRPAVLKLDSSPPGATVLVDDSKVGVTPVEVEVEAGRHRIALRLPGYVELSRDLDLAGGVRESYSMQLAPIDVGKRKPILAWPGWTLVGLGAGSVVAGISLVAIDEQPIKSRCDGTNIDAQGNCRYRHNTLPLGLALTIGGALLAGAGATILIVRRNRGGHRKNARIVPTASGLAFRF